VARIIFFCFQYDPRRNRLQLGVCSQIEDVEPSLTASPKMGLFEAFLIIIINLTFFFSGIVDLDNNKNFQNYDKTASESGQVML